MKILLFAGLILSSQLFAMDFVSGSYKLKDKYFEKSLQITLTPNPKVINYKISAIGKNGNTCEDISGQAIIIPINGVIGASSIPGLDGFIKSSQGVNLTPNECGGVAFVPSQNGKIMDVLSKDCQSYLCGMNVDYEGTYKKIK